MSSKIDKFLYDIFGYVATRYDVEWKLDEVVEDYKKYRQDCIEKGKKVEEKTTELIEESRCIYKTGSNTQCKFKINLTSANLNACTRHLNLINQGKPLVVYRKMYIPGEDPEENRLTNNVRSIATQIRQIERPKESLEDMISKVETLSGFSKFNGDYKDPRSNDPVCETREVYIPEYKSKHWCRIVEKENGEKFITGLIVDFEFNKLENPIKFNEMKPKYESDSSDSEEEPEGNSDQLSESGKLYTKELPDLSESDSGSSSESESESEEET